jgi:hypothetical protein
VPEAQLLKEVTLFASVENKVRKNDLFGGKRSKMLSVVRAQKGSILTFLGRWKKGQY